ncbi:MAG TPA: hypothetical protein VKB10_04990 [Gaiellaceae bacterium]|nr:hypothetical protein [Gaiellaceae bacterium]
MRRAVLAAAVAALAAPAAGLAETQQVLLPGPAPYATPSPPLATVAPPPWANLTFRIHSRSDQQVRVGTNETGRPVSLRVLQRLHLTGTGDYLIVVSAPVVDVRAGEGSQSQPGLRRGQILWSGFSSRRKLLAADATLRPGAAAPFLPLRLEARRDGDRYALTITNATGTSQISFEGAGRRKELARLLDRTRKESLGRARLSSAYVTIEGLVTQRAGRSEVVAPLRVEGELRFPSAPSAASGGTISGRTVRFTAVLGDERPLVHRVEVRGGGEPKLHVEAKPTNLVRALTPPSGRTWADAVERRPLPAEALLRRLLDARMELVRSDQYRAFLSNPDPQGRNRTTYVYLTAPASVRAAAAKGSDEASAGGPLMVLVAVGGAVLAAGAALVAWAHS